MIIQIIKLQSNLQEEELLKKAQERAPQFRKLKGLQQKYYVKQGQPGHYAGVYIWESKEDMMAYKESDLAATIPDAYQIVSPPQIEIMEGLFRLRD